MANIQDVMKTVERRNAGEQEFLQAVREVLGWDLADGGWSAHIVDAETGEEVASQTHFSDGTARVTWMLPGEYEDGAQRTYEVSLGDQRPTTGAQRTDGDVGVTVERTDDELIVRTPWFAAHHDLSAGGILGAVEFADDGMLPTRTNDRLYHEELGQYYLVNDPDPELEVVSEGPLEVVIRSTARYCLGDGTPAPGEPKATYEFAYNAHSPTVRMSARVRQSGAADWDQVHVFEMYHKTDGPFFDTVAWGPPLESMPFVDEHNTHTLRNSAWGALMTDQVALGLIGPDLYGIHTGLSGHGVYVHGPWHTFRGGEQHYEATLYLGPSGGSPEARAERLARLSSRWDVSVRVPAMQGLIDQVGDAINAAEPGVADRLEGARQDDAERLLDVARFLAADAERSASSLAAIRDWRRAVVAAGQAVGTVSSQWTVQEPPAMTLVFQV